MNPQAAQPKKQASVRRGIVIVAVLLVVTLLSLAAYQYADLMLAEAAVTENVHRAAQTRAFAESGIWYTAALLSNPNNAGLLNGNPYNNPQLFQDIAVPGDNGVTGRFSIVGPADPPMSGSSSSSGSTNMPSYGVIDETGKINLVSWMNIDPTGTALLNILGALPNMTPQIAANIVAWMGGSAGISAGGAQDDYYQSLNPPYRCKNNVPDSLDELLMVQLVTRDLLYGADVNRNAVEDGSEQAATTSTIPPASGFDRGWSAFLTVHSREQNCDQNGNPFIWINNPDLQQLYAALAQDVDENLAKFVIMYLEYGPGSSTGGTQGLGSTIKALLGSSSKSGASGSGSTGSSSTGSSGTNNGSNGNNNAGSNNSNGSNSNLPQGNLSSYQVQFIPAKYTINSFFQLVNAKVNIQSTDPTTNKTVTTQYVSPLYNNVNYQRQVMPLLFTYCTLFAQAEIPCRININTAPQEIITGLQYVNPVSSSGGSSGSSGSSSSSGSMSSSSSSSSSSSMSSSSSSGSSSMSGGSGLQDTDVQNIITMRQQASGQSGDIYATPTWLLTEANISPQVLQVLDPYITTRSQVYRVQSVGYYDGGKGPAARIEAVIDTNAGRPRIIVWRNLSELGKGWTDPGAPSANSGGPGASSNP